MTRQCGGCTACCKLLPMKPGNKAPKTLAAMIEHGIMSIDDAASMTPDFDKPAGERCPHQRHHKGCTTAEEKIAAFGGLKIALAEK